MKQKIHIQPLLALIILTVVLIIGTLYTTRYAIQDFEHIAYSQRSHFKTFAITTMGNSYFKNSMKKDKYDGTGIGSFLEKSLSAPGEGIFILRWDPKNDYPILYIGGDDRFKKYYRAGSFMKGINMTDSLGITAKENLMPMYDKITTYQTTNDEKPIVYAQNDGKKYLITWVIIPSPTPEQAEFLCLVFTPTATIDQAIDFIKMKYVWLFSGACAIAGIMLILIPITIRKFTSEFR